MQFATTANVSRLIQILAKQYEENPRVVLRELVQNAADAITLARRDDPDVDELIEIEILPDDAHQHRAHLAIRDRAAGMTAVDLSEYLTQLGSGTKIDDVETIGEWGIGFYATVVICRSVIVATKARNSDIITFRYLVDEDRYIPLDKDTEDWLTPREFAGADRPTGTTVILEVDYDKWPQLRDWLNRQRLETELRTFCLFVPYPIRVISADRVSSLDDVNLPQTPWQRTGAEREKALADLWARTLVYSSPENYPVLSHCFHSSPDANSTFSGVCFFLPKYHGGTQLYFKNIYVELARDVLPTWASPFSLIINIRSDTNSQFHLSVPPSRTHVVRNESFFRWLPLIQQTVGNAIESAFGLYTTDLQGKLATADAERRSQGYEEVTKTSAVVDALQGVTGMLRNICLDLGSALAVACSDDACHRDVKLAAVELLQERVAVKLDADNIVQALKEHAKFAKDAAVKERARQRDTHECPTWCPDESEWFLTRLGHFLPMPVVVKEFPHGKRPQFTRLQVPVAVLHLLDASLLDHEEDSVRLPVLTKGDPAEYLVESDADRLVLVPDSLELAYVAALCARNERYHMNAVSTRDTAFRPATYPKEWEDLKAAFDALVGEKARLASSEPPYVVDVAGFERQEFPIVLHEDDTGTRRLTINAYNRGMKGLKEAFNRSLEAGSSRTERALRSLIHDLYHCAAYPRETPLTEATLHSLEVKDETLTNICEVVAEALDARINPE